MKVLKSTFVIHSVIPAMANAFTAPIAASDSTTSRIESEPFRGGISVYDSSIYAPLFTTKEMAAIFNDAVSSVIGSFMNVNSPKQKQRTTSFLKLLQMSSTKSPVLRTSILKNCAKPRSRLAVPLMV